MIKALFPVGIAVLMTGCVFTPELVTRYDAACDIETRHMVLSAQQTGLSFEAARCTDESCLAFVLAVDVLMVPVSAIVSGSIVVVGNTVFWMQRRGQCADGDSVAATLGPMAVSAA